MHQANCYLCGEPSLCRPGILRDTFTGHTGVRSPHSTTEIDGVLHYLLCDRCYDLLFDNSRVWLWRDDAPKKSDPTQKGEWSSLFTRGLSWLISKTEQYPRLGDPVTVATVDKNGKAKAPLTLRQIFDLPKREQIRQWLIEPPEPPFQIIVGESGQKYCFYFAKWAQSRDRFPVVLEQDLIYIDRPEFTRLLAAYETLRGLGFSREEINAGSYAPNKLVKCLTAGQSIQVLDGIISPYRKTRTLDLAAYVSRRPVCIQSANPETSGSGAGCGGVGGADSR